MKDTQLTLRLSRDLARALARWARDRGVAKSEVAREAVARYLLPTPASGPPFTAAELAARWGELPGLTAREAEDLAADIDAGRRKLPAPRAAWD
ncbi:MAG TPA: CopG family transcriptional regulator [Gemmatimonadales bacterium]|jgi:hypothetical protein